MAQLIAYEPWGVTIDPVPGAAFHAVVAGGCWLRSPGRAPQHLMPGDVVLLPTNTPHELVSSVDARTDSLARFETDIPRTPEGDMVIQGPGAGTRLLCAAYDYDHEVAHPLMSQLPPILHVPAGMPGDDGGVAATLRLLALRDPVVARAMNAIHQRPAEPWTIESLAREVSVSRATLARRFAHLVGETPPDYLTRWRMDLAAQRLRDTDDTVAAIAAAIGYRSEYSFSRAFTRHRGLAPGRYRRHTRARALAAAHDFQ